MGWLMRLLRGQIEMTVFRAARSLTPEEAQAFNAAFEKMEGAFKALDEAFGKLK